jgi:tetratricopeptide (TPR) repeat protein
VNSRILLARLIYWQNRDARQAFEYLRQAEEIEASSMALTAVRVAILRAEGQLQEAQRILDEHVANRSDFESYLMRGIHFANQGDLARAEEDYRKLTTFADRGVVAYDVLSSFYARSGKLDRAIAALEEGLKAHPDDVRLRRQLMKALFLPGDTRDLARASALLEKLRQELPQDPELMKIGALQTLQDATPESIATARDLLERVIKLEPTAVDAHLALIHIAMVEGRAEVARDHAIRALGPNPSDPLLLTARGRAELALGNPQMAAELVSMVLQTDPNHLGAIEILVTAALNTQDKSLLEKACTFLDPVAARDPGNERLQLARARMLVLLGRPKDGIPALETYVRTEPGSRSVEAVVMLADLYRLSGDAEQAGRRIEQVEQIDPNGQTAIYARLLLLLSQKRFSDLEGISAAFLAAQRQEPAILMTAASTLAAQNSTSLKKEGLKLFEHLVSLSPTSLDAQASLASTLYLVGDADRAKKIYGDLLKQQPKNARVLNDLAWILHEHDHEYDKALELADAGLQYAPSDLDLLDTRGTIQTHISGRLGNARSDFERLVNLAPADTSRRAKALLQLGRVCAKLNDLAAARQHLTNALNIDRKIDVFSPDERAEIQRLLQSGDGR